jgi:hypothetical protein
MKRLVALLFSLVACTASVGGSDDDVDPDVDDETRSNAVATSHDALGKACYCTGAAACKSSRSAAYMFPAARKALAAAGVAESQLTQTYGDAAASVGTHCPEPGHTYSGATDMNQGASPCDRVRKLRAQGFAAWYRTAPFAPHIHAVYAGTTGMKSSLLSQVNSFLQGRNGLAGNAVETNCPISAADKAAVQAARTGTTKPPEPKPPTPTPPTPPAPPGGNGTPTIPGPCMPGGDYCGGDKLVGDANTLYECNPDGLTGTVIQVCANGCSVNAAVNDSCN